MTSKRLGSELWHCVVYRYTDNRLWNTCGKLLRPRLGMPVSRLLDGLRGRIRFMIDPQGRETLLRKVYG